MSALAVRSHRRFAGWGPVGLGVLLLSCFDPAYNQCRLLCGAGDPGLCPPGFACVAFEGQNVCKQAGRECPATALRQDGGGPHPDRLCYGQDCVTLGDAAKAGLAVWLEPSTLPRSGTRVARWPDRSGNNNSAVALSDTWPTALADGTAFAAEPGAAFRIASSASLDFGDEDFVLLMVFRAAVSSSCLVSKSELVHARQIKVQWVFSSTDDQTLPVGWVNYDSVTSTRLGLADEKRHLLVWARSGTHLTLRIDGAAAGDRDTVGPVPSSSNTADLFLGTCGAATSPILSIHTFIALHGAGVTADLPGLEALLVKSFVIAP